MIQLSFLDSVVLPVFNRYRSHLKVDQQLQSMATRLVEGQIQWAQGRDGFDKPFCTKAIMIINNFKKPWAIDLPVTQAPAQPGEGIRGTSAVPSKI